MSDVNVLAPQWIEVKWLHLPGPEFPHLWSSACSTHPRGWGLWPFFNLPGSARVLSHRRKDGKSGSQPGAVLPSRGRWVISGDSFGGHSLEQGCLPLASNGERPGMLLDSPLRQRITQHRICPPCCWGEADPNGVTIGVIREQMVGASGIPPWPDQSLFKRWVQGLVWLKMGRFLARSFPKKPPWAYLIKLFNFF